MYCLMGLNSLMLILIKLFVLSFAIVIALVSHLQGVSIKMQDAATKVLLSNVHWDTRAG